MDRATRIISVLEKELVIKDKQIKDMNEREAHLKAIVVDLIQIVSDLVDPDCPEGYTDIADQQLSLCIEQFFEIY